MINFEERMVELLITSKGVMFMRFGGLDLGAFTHFKSYSHQSSSIYKRFVESVEAVEKEFLSSFVLGLEVSRGRPISSIYKMSAPTQVSFCDNF